MNTKLKQKTLIAFVLDKSSSMESCRAATISGFNEYVATLKKDKKSSYEMTLTLFDTSVDTKFIASPLKDVEDLNESTYRPSGMTALYDAVGLTVEATAKEVKKGQKVLCVIMTDGEENSSREYDTHKIAARIKELEKKGWTFVFMGANQDAWQTGQKFGFLRANVANYNATSLGSKAAFRSVAQNTCFYSASDASETRGFFSDQDKDDLEKTK